MRRGVHGVRERRPRAAGHRLRRARPAARRAGRAGHPLGFGVLRAAADAPRLRLHPGRLLRPGARHDRRGLRQVRARACPRPGCWPWSSRRSGTRPGCARCWPTRWPRTCRWSCSAWARPRPARRWWRRTPARWPRPTARGRRWPAPTACTASATWPSWPTPSSCSPPAAAGRRRGGPAPGIATVHDSGLERAHTADLAAEARRAVRRDQPGAPRPGWPRCSTRAWRRPTRWTSGGPAATPSRCSPTA